MADVVAARNAYLEARGQVKATRLALGRAIAEARSTGVDQTKIASELRLTREQVRRYQAEYEKKVAEEAEAAAAGS
jgi:hypothetical protein